MSGEVYMSRYANKHRISASAGMTIFILFAIIGCSKSGGPKPSDNIGLPHCNYLYIFPHPNNAGITLSILTMNKNTKKVRIIGIGNEVCEGYRLYRILPEGIELINNNERTKQIAYASSDIIAEPAIKLEKKNRKAAKKAEQLQKYGIPQTMSHIHGANNSKNAIVNSFSGTKFTPK